MHVCWSDVWCLMSAGVQWYFKIDGDSDVFLVKHDVALLRWQSVVTNPCVCYMYLSDVSLCVCVCACVIVCFFSVGMEVSFWLWATFDGSESGFLKLWKWSQITQQLILFNLSYSLEMPLKSGNISGNFEPHLSSCVIWVLYRLDHLILSLLLNKRETREKDTTPPLALLMWNSSANNAQSCLTLGFTATAYSHH